VRENGAKISVYKSIYDTKPIADVNISEYLEKIKNGWLNRKDEIQEIRMLDPLGSDEENVKYEALKKKLSGCTISGCFKKRKNKELESHSGLLAIDIDNKENINDILFQDDGLQRLKERLKQEPWVYSIFISVGGRGLCCVVKIKPTVKAHSEAFKALKKYFLKTYNLTVDPRCSDVSHFRYISSDPELYYKPDAEIYIPSLDMSVETTKLPTASLATNKQETFKLVGEIVEKVVKEEIMMGDDSYNDWMKIGFALVDEFGETGREFFHKISAISSKYDQETCDKQYTKCLNAGKRFDNKVGIGTFFYYAEKAGLYQIAVLNNDIHNTELGNAQRLTSYFGGTIRYCGTLKKWFVWNEQNGAWQIDDNGQVQRLAKRTIQNMFCEASNMVDSEERRNLIKWGLASESATKIQAMIKLAESEEGIAISPDELDLNPWLLNCRNGTIDLRTGELKEHDKGDLITKSIPVIYDPNAKCLKWLKFLDRIMGGNQELISFLQRAVGYTLTGATREQCFFILHGDGANGKSTFIKTIGSLLGDYAQAASFETFLSKKQGNVANNDIARMQGKRFISAVEAEESRRLAENVIKQVTGGDVVTARFLFKEYFEFIPQFKIFLAANHKPKISCNDSAIWRRVKLVPFNEKILEDERIDDLDDQLKEELSGILNWSLHGCLDWQENGLKTPVEVESATKEYRYEMDNVSEFLRECCDLASNYRESPAVLYEAYKTRCDLNGEKYLCLKEFGKSLNDKGYLTRRSNGKNWRTGIKLLNQNHDFDLVSVNSPIHNKEEPEKLCAQL